MTQSNAASIAIIIPVYNVTTFLEEAIRSAVSQNYPQQEVIVVDDGSLEKHAAEIAHICGQFAGITLLHQPHTGAAAARDRGVSYSSADFIMFLDADDAFLPGAVEYLAEALHNTPSAVATYARRMKIDKYGNVSGEPKPSQSHMVSGDKILDLLLKIRSPLANGAICVRKQALRNLSPGHHSITLGEDWVLWCHLALSGNIIPAGERVVLHRRIHEKNISHTVLQDYSPVLKSFDAIFTNSKFIAAVGKDRLREYRERCHCAMHAHLAGKYAAQSNHKKAIFHFKQVTLPLASFVDGVT